MSLTEHSAITTGAQGALVCRPAVARTAAATEEHRSPAAVAHPAAAAARVAAMRIAAVFLIALFAFFAAPRAAEGADWPFTAADTTSWEVSPVTAAAASPEFSVDATVVPQDFASWDIFANNPASNSPEFVVDATVVPQDFASWEFADSDSTPAAANAPYGTGITHDNDGTTSDGRSLLHYLNGTTSVAYATYYSDNNGASVPNPNVKNARLRLVQKNGGEETTLFSSSTASAPPVSGIFAWDTTTKSDGHYTLYHSFYNNGSSDDEVCTSISQKIVIANAYVLHSGDLTANETWGAGKPHLVTDRVYIPAGVTLNITAGAIVKFAEGTEIYVAESGVLNVSGAILTHIADDAHGGDSNFDGSATSPNAGKYAITGTGVINIDSDTQELYPVPLSYSGSLSGDETWRAGRRHIITGTLTIPNGRTLTILPGAVVKFNSGTGITINAGGTLNAIGTLQGKITFTSIKDDEHGGDTNGDGRASTPNMGDWLGITSAGTLNLTHSEVFYASNDANNSSSSNTSGLLRITGGVTTVDSCLLAHGKFDAIYKNGGTATFVNTVIWDTDRFTGYGTNSNTTTFTNCVFYMATTPGNGSYLYAFQGGTLKNCIVFGAKSFGSFTASNCVFWNPKGYGPQTYSQDGVKWADPLFQDAEHENFTLRPGSPCIDAADGTAAPERDALAQERVDDPHVANIGTPAANGFIPDIGAYEYTGNAFSNIDLTGEVLAAPATLTVGNGNFTVRYVIRNIGTQAAKGMLKNTLSFTSTYGTSTVAGFDTIAVNLAPGASVEFEKSLPIPALADGDYRLQLRVNADGTIIEGANANNNLSTWAQTVSISMPTVDARKNFTVKGNSSETLKFLAAADAARVVLIEAQQGLHIFGAFGVVPGESAYDLEAVYCGNGTYAITIPQGGGAFYLTIQNPNPASASVVVEPVANVLRLSGVSTNTLPATGRVTFSVYGIGFTENSTVEIAGGISVENLRLVSANELRLTAVPNNAAVGNHAITVRDGTAAATLPSALSVVAGGGVGGAVDTEIESWLEMPNAARDGRVATAWVVYQNKGSSDKPAPIFSVTTSTNTRMCLESDGAFSSEKIRLVGISKTIPAGLLKVGETMRIPYYFIPTGEFKFTLWSLNESSKSETPPAEFSTWNEYRDAIAEAATRINLRGKQEWRFTKIQELALGTLRGKPVAAISGHLRHAVTKQPLAGYHLEAEPRNSVSQIITDENGFFSIEGVGIGESISLNAPHLANLSITKFAAKTNANDINGLVVTALPHGVVSGFLRKGGTGVSVEGYTIVVSDSFGERHEGKTDVHGYYRIDDIHDGVYQLGVVPQGGYFAKGESEIKINSGNNQATIDLSLELGGVITGIVKDSINGNILQSVTVVAENASGQITAVSTTDVNGFYQMAGIPNGTYLLFLQSEKYVSRTKSKLEVSVGDTKNQNLFAVKQPGFYPEIPVSYSTVTTSFNITDEELKNATYYEWDFNSDGIIDSIEKNPTYTYTTPGIYTVTLKTKNSEDVVTTSIAFDCIEVRQPTPLVYSENTIFVDKRTDIVFVSKNESSILLRESVPTVISSGNFIVGGADGGYCRKVISVSRDGNIITLATIEATILEAFESGNIDELARQLSLSGQETLRLVSRNKLLHIAADTDKFLKIPISLTFSQKPSEGGEMSFSAKGEALISVEPHKPIFDWNSKMEMIYLSAFLDLEYGLEIGAEIEVKAEIKKDLKKDLDVIKIPVPAFPLLQVHFPARFGTEIALGAEAKLEYTHKDSQKRRIGWEGTLHYDTVSTNIRVINDLLSKSEENIVSGEFSGSFSVKPYFKPRVEVGFYVDAPFGDKFDTEVAAFIGLEAYLKGEVKVISGGFSTPIGKSGGVTEAEAGLLSASLVAGLDAEAGIKWKIPMKSEKELKLEIELFGEDGIPLVAWKASASKMKVESDGQTATVNDLSHSGSIAPINKSKWDFGDGTKIEARHDEVVKHKYEKPGVYTITLISSGILSFNKPAKQEIYIGKDKEDPEKKENENGGIPPQSFDPNEMVGPAGVGAPRFVQPRDWLQFRVHFENKSDASAAACEVWVKENLSSYLDFSTFELEEVYFAGQTELGLFGKSQGAIEVARKNAADRVRVEARFDPATGKAEWYLRSVDPTAPTGWPEDPYAGFLEPNDATGRGEGYVAYRIKVREDAPHNARIDSTATIVFDYNEPIVTDPAWFNTVYADNNVPTIPAFPESAQDQTATLGEAFTLHAPTASGYGTLEYEWEKDGVILEGKTGATLDFSGVTAADAGTYRVRVRNIFGETWSETFTLTVQERAPEITEEPEGAVVGFGRTWTFSVAATGAVPLSYQWYFSATGEDGTFHEIPDATNATLTIYNASEQNDGFYYVTVRNPISEVKSDYARLHVSVGGYGTYALVSSGAKLDAKPTDTKFAKGGKPVYEWTKDGEVLRDAKGRAIKDDVGVVTVKEDGHYKVIVRWKSQSGEEKTATQEWNVNIFPVLKFAKPDGLAITYQTTEPKNFTNKGLVPVKNGVVIPLAGPEETKIETVTFTAKLETPPSTVAPWTQVIFRWYLDGRGLVRESEPTYVLSDTFTTTGLTDKRKIFVTVETVQRDRGGKILSFAKSPTITVKGITPPSVGISEVKQTEKKLIIKTKTTGTAKFAYQWYHTKEGATEQKPIYGATKATLELPTSHELYQTGTYTVRVTNAAGDTYEAHATSPTVERILWPKFAKGGNKPVVVAYLKANGTPGVNPQDNDPKAKNSVVQGEKLRLSITLAQGEGTFIYRWYKNNTKILVSEEETKATMELTDTLETDVFRANPADSYFVTIETVARNAKGDKPLAIIKSATFKPKVVTSSAMSSALKVGSVGALAAGADAGQSGTGVSPVGQQSVPTTQSSALNTAANSTTSAARNTGEPPVPLSAAAVAPDALAAGTIIEFDDGGNNLVALEILSATELVRFPAAAATANAEYTYVRISDTAAILAYAIENPDGTISTGEILLEFADAAGGTFTATSEAESEIERASGSDVESESGSASGSGNASGIFELHSGE